jgi:hypothetical protein
MPRLSMKDNQVRQSILGLLLALGLAVGATDSAFAQPSPQTPPARVAGEGRLYNLTSRPFTFQLHRRDGVKWTDGYVVQPGNFFSVKVPRAGERDDIMGISGNGQGFVIVRFREPTLGGFMTLRLPATNPASLKLEPTWFAVEDANGIVRLVQEAGVEQAKATQENLRKQTPMIPAELESMKQTLRNNWVLTN